MFFIQRLYQKTANLKNIPLQSLVCTLRRKYSSSTEGKTTVHIMNNDSEYGLMINGYSQVGFRLNNDMTILGPMAIFPRTVLSWNVGHYKDMNEDSLMLFTVLEPKLDILVLGTGDYTNNTELYQTIIKFMRKHRINIEILPTEKAVSTFNFLNSEGRYVGGAFIPPDTMKTTENDVIKSKMRYQNIYDIE